MNRILITIGAICIALAAAKIFYLDEELDSLLIENNKLKMTNTILELNNSSLNERLKLFNEAAVLNKATIEDLKKEREQSLKAIQGLSRAKTINDGKLETVAAKIEINRNTPNTDGPIAPVLKETIREIQILRNAQ